MISYDREEDVLYVGEITNCITEEVVLGILLRRVKNKVVAITIMDFSKWFIPNKNELMKYIPNNFVNEILGYIKE